MSSVNQTLRLGTRGSLLAVAQSSWVAREVERLNPGVQVQLITIETQGDRILDVPLRHAEGKEFFVAELDEALREGRVDFCVHSLKDLSLERSQEFILAAVPRRENPRDVVFFDGRVIEKLKRGEVLRVGTSSPRRLALLPGFLEQALPWVSQEGGHPQIKFVELRGNVNTRLSRLHEPLTSERHLDGVVLAAAGILRLAADPERGVPALRELLVNPTRPLVRWMVLPLSVMPTAPGQGALAVECRRRDSEIVKILRALHCETTEQGVKKEREILAQWGGGCHLPLGASSKEVEGLGHLMWVKGRHPNGPWIDEVQWKKPAPRHSTGLVFSGREHRPFRECVRDSLCVPSESLWFVAHSRSLPQSWVESARERRLWTSGVASWFRLAAQGLWVEGCSEGLGAKSFFSEMQGFFQRFYKEISSLKKLQWAYLTHGQARDLREDLGADFRDVATYDLESVPLSDEIKMQVQKAQYFYWTSASQYEVFKPFFGDKKSQKQHHACGPGHTALHLKKQGIAVEVFPTYEEWKLWIESPT